MNYFALFLVFFIVPVAAGNVPVQPQSRGEARIDQLFGQLKQAQTPEDAKPIEEEISVIFMQSGSPSVDLLMTRAESAAAGGDKDAARQILDDVTKIAPDFAEGWHRRAAAQLADDDNEGAMVSLQRVILLNPREFRAMSELADMLDDYGDKSTALKLYRRAIALDPKLRGAGARLKALEVEVEGQRI